MPARSHHQSTIRGRLVLLAVLAMSAALASLTLAASASAAQYSVDSCQHPDNATAPTDGWTGSYAGAYVFYADNCGNGGGLESSWAGDIEHGYQQGASWLMTAPANTTLAGLTARRDSAAGPDRPYGSPVAYISSDQGTIEACTRYSGCGALNGDIAYGLNGASSVRVGIVCGGGPGGSCPIGGGTSSSLKRIITTFNDDSAPALAGAPSGPLLSANTTTRSRTLNYSATDQGGGVYRQRLLADGANELASSVVDANGGKCVRYPVGGNFSYRAPCRTAASGSVTYDTAGLSDGTHELSLEVRDATDANKTSYGPWPVLVDNQPPAITGTTEITGTARVNSQLTCVPPSINGQSPTISYTWARSNTDGSARTVIPDAEASRYTLTTADQGKKITCTVTARDAGGTNSRESSLTSGPFNNGGSVAAGTGPTPTGTTTIVANGGKDAGQPHPGDVLTLDPPTYAGTNVALAYQWLRCDTAGQSCVTIPSATGRNYTVVDADKDRRLVAQVTATDASGTSSSRSEPTGVVTPGGAGTAGPVKDPVSGGGGPGGPGDLLKLADGAANGTNACRDAKLTARFVSGTKTTVRFGRAATLRGKLVCGPTGRAIGGAKIALAARTFGRTLYWPAGLITTAEDGTFTRVLARGPGRQLTLSYTAVGGDATPAATAAARMHVRGKITLKALRPRVKRGGRGRIVFRGRLHVSKGQIPGGFRLLLQAQDGRRWRLADPIKVKPDGSFRHVYRCACRTAGALYRFRVTIPGGTRLPYTAAHSRSYKVRVR